MRRIFILCSGQEDNIGDVVLRRRLLDELRQHGQLHVFLGQASAGFIEGLDLSQADTVYGEKRTWRRSLWSAIRQGDAWLVDKPGELLLDRRHLIAQARLAVSAVCVRLRGGLVLRLGLGQRAPRPSYTPFYRALFATSNAIAWRDPASHAAFRIGTVMPDWGFGEQPSARSRPRHRLAISYRSDRPDLSDEALRSIKAFAVEAGLEPVVVTQVGRDSERSISLAHRLGCELIDWPTARSHRDQERALREVYSESAIVLSDRLHVLIVGMTEGAIPLCLTEHDESKVARHFHAVGLDNVAVRIEPRGAAAAETALRDAMQRGDEIEAALGVANERIDAVGAYLTRGFSTSSSSMADGK